MAIFRRQFITEPRYQLRFTFALLRGLAIATVVPAAVFLGAYFLAIQKSEAYRHAELTKTVPVAVAMFACAVMLVALVTVLFAVYLSHKYVGPLRRIEAFAARHLLGHPNGKLTLRPGDELLSVASSITEIVSPVKGEAS